ncbi:short-chain dehydrogenase/reductase SDR [Biscogniauxia mediterranea]|nr:short-chain dehydrogenase/reductase SDR [Biscogniauxia mediterranea]
MALLAGKVAIVTGGVTGIGRAIARDYIRHGACVAVNFLGDPASQAHFETLKREIGGNADRLIGVAGDIGERATGAELVRQTVDKFGSLDVFVANAGVSQFRDFLTLDEDTLAAHIHTNITGTFWTTQAAANQMVRQNRGGSIIGISSISAHLGGARQVHYTPTKAAVLSMMQSQACALGRYGIRCNALLPGTTRTQLAAEDLAVPEKLKYLETRTPLGRVGEPADLGGPAVFLASDLSRFVTGAQLLVDGGISISLQ